VLLQVNSRATDNFFQTIRRRLSILERPLITSRDDGKSYIYSNYNPKYAQYAVTIVRTFYNFCFAQGKTKVDSLTPAMKLVLADKIYNYKDILYFIF
jgi:hypothetical protein